LIESLMRFLHGIKMSKVNKKVLKSIVKECLVEILAEGLIQSPGSSIEKKRSLKEAVESRGRVIGRQRLDPRMGKTNESPPAARQNRGSYLDQVSYGQNSNEDVYRTQPQQDNRANQLISSVTKDPIMSEIFADTAASTLKAQAGAEGRRGTAVPSTPADEAARIVEASDPMELFGDSARNWADMAFAPKINR